MADNRYRTTIQFNMNDIVQRNALNFLARCGRRKNRMLALAVTEFMEKYDLSIESIDNAELTNFLNAYPYMKDKINGASSKTKESSNKPIHKEKTQDKPVSADMKEKADKSLAAFGL